MNGSQGFNKKWWWLPAGLLAATVLYSFMPLPQASRENCASVTGKIVKVEPGTGKGDIVLAVAGDDGYYYINRGLDHGVNMSALTSQLLNKTATVCYIRHWSLLNINGKTRHIGRIVVNDQVVYNEWKEN